MISKRSIQRVLLPVLGFCLALMLWAPSAFAVKGIIQSPLLTDPSFVIPGDKLEIKAVFQRQVSLVSLTLKDSKDDSIENVIDLSNREAAGEQTLEVQVPSDMAPGLYNLCITYNLDGKESFECRPHAVAVIEGYKDSFTFAVFSDFHSGDTRGEKNKPGIKLEELRAKAIEALSRSGADFALMPGDMTSYPTTYFMDYPRCFKEIAGTQIPIFVIPGNHDLYSQVRDMPRTVDGADYWDKTFGPMHLAFTYGKFRFIGANSYSWPLRYRDRNEPELLRAAGSSSAGTISLEEFEWLKGEIDKAKAQGLTPIVFSHHGPKQMSPFAGAEDYQCVTPDKYLQFLKDRKVPYYFYGHTHANYEDRDGEIDLVSTGTVSSGIDPGEPGWAFRLVEVKPDGSFNMRLEVFWKPQPAK